MQVIATVTTARACSSSLATDITPPSRLQKRPDTSRRPAQNLKCIRSRRRILLSGERWITDGTSGLSLINHTNTPRSRSRFSGRSAFVLPNGGWSILRYIIRNGTYNAAN